MSGEPSGARGDATSVMTRAVAKLLLLPTLLTAAAILVKGYAQPGDGFSAGVVAALGILLQYLSLGHERAERLPLVRHALTMAFAGLLVALAVAIAPLFLGEAILTHSPPPRSEVMHLGTLELITAVVFDVGVFLLVFGFGVGTVVVFVRAMAGESEYAGTAGDVDASREGSR